MTKTQRSAFAGPRTTRTLAIVLAIALVLTCGAPAHAAKGVSPYLPLNLSPEIERQIEQVLALAGQPVIRRPIAAATVQEALPRACKVDLALCKSVERYLRRYMQGWGVTDASVEAGSSADSTQPIPNRRGQPWDSEWDAAARAYWQPGDYLILSAGGATHRGDSTPAGSMLSVGTEYMQIDVGWREHWLSPMSDSSFLISTEAPTMPSVTISNYRPVTGLGLQYEFFVAEASSQSNILNGDGVTEGKPHLAGLHLAAEPFSGWSFGVSRVMQYGGGGRRDSLRDLLKAFFDPTNYDNVSSVNDDQFGNQVASITSSLVIPGRVPFTAYVEYAGEDTVRNRMHLLGNAALSVGARWPSLPGNLDLTLEASEWQNAWYVHPIYPDGMTNKGLVTGHWFGNQRIKGDDVIGHSAMVRLGWRPWFGGQMSLRYRMLRNDSYSPPDYHDAHEASISYARAWGHIVAGAEVMTGRDVFGADLSQGRVFVRWSELPDVTGSSSISPATSLFETGDAEVFVDVGVNATQVAVDEYANPSPDTTSVRAAGHLGIGVRRIGEGRSDFGARIELDDIEGELLTSVRMIDYRYRFKGSLAASFFLGASRYDLATPAYGLYYGLGVQWRNVLEGWDLNLDGRFAEKVSRDYVLPNDPDSDRRNAYYDIYGVSLYFSRRF